MECIYIQTKIIYNRLTSAVNRAPILVDVSALDLPNSDPIGKYLRKRTF